MLLAPHVVEIAPLLLVGLSAMEDSRLSYTQFHVANMGHSAERFEAGRSAIASESPVGQLLRKLVPLIQDMGPMLPRLTSLLRTGVGGNTRAGTCDFLSQVASS